MNTHSRESHRTLARMLHVCSSKSRLTDATLWLARTEIRMNRLVRGGIAGFAAWKWGGGIFGAIILFIIVFYLLGYL